MPRVSDEQMKAWIAAQPYMSYGISGKEILRDRNRQILREYNRNHSSGFQHVCPGMTLPAKEDFISSSGRVVKKGTLLTTLQSFGGYDFSFSTPDGHIDRVPQSGQARSYFDF